MSTEQDIIGFVCLPSFAFASHIAVFLDGEDVLAMRCTSSRLKHLVDDEAPVLWPSFLQTEFGYQQQQGKDDDEANHQWRTLQVMPQQTQTHARRSVFGTSASQAVISMSSPFQAWIQWKRASYRYSSGRRDFRLIAPYFLRSANIWARMEQWLLQQGSFGSSVQLSLYRGQRLEDLTWPEHLRTLSTVQATQALFAFYGGQDPRTDYWKALFGGYQVYNRCTTTFLSAAEWSDQTSCIEITYPNSNFNTRSIVVNAYTGEIGFERSGTKVCPSEEMDAVLDWFDEYVTRLETGYYRTGYIFSNHGILHFPQLVGRGATRAVTRGVEVVASAVSAPRQLGIVFAYSIRLRLVLPNEEGYAANRGFDSCQLKSRHWRIMNQHGQVDNVDGDGVIGIYPLLREGSHRADQGETSESVIPDEEESHGTFQYQSFVDASATSFGGYLLFVPGSLANPSGPAFQVHLAPFPLDPNPVYQY